MNIQGRGRELTDRRGRARLVDCEPASRRVKQLVGQAAGSPVIAEEVVNVVPQLGRELRRLWPPSKPGERYVDEEVLKARPDNGVPTCGSGDSLENGESAANAPQVTRE